MKVLNSQKLAAGILVAACVLFLCPSQGRPEALSLEKALVRAGLSKERAQYIHARVAKRLNPENQNVLVKTLSSFRTREEVEIWSQKLLEGLAKHVPPPLLLNRLQVYAEDVKWAYTLSASLLKSTPPTYTVKALVDALYRTPDNNRALLERFFSQVQKHINQLNPHQLAQLADVAGLMCEAGATQQDLERMLRKITSSGKIREKELYRYEKRILQGIKKGFSFQEIMIRMDNPFTGEGTNSPGTTGTKLMQEMPEQFVPGGEMGVPTQIPTKKDKFHHNIP